MVGEWFPLSRRGRLREGGLNSKIEDQMVGLGTKDGGDSKLSSKTAPNDEHSVLNLFSP